MGLVIGHLCRQCGLDTLEIACAACGGRITWSRRAGYRCSGCGERPAAAACRDCGTVAPLADRTVSQTRPTRTRSPPATWAPWELAAPPPSGWPIFIALAVFLHAALIVPLIAGRAGSDGAPSATQGVGPTETVTVVDLSAIPQPAGRDALSGLPAASGGRTDMPLTSRLVRAALDAGEAAAARRDTAANGAADTPGSGQGAAPLPFDVLPMPTPSPPPTKAAKPQKVQPPAAPPKPTMTRAPRQPRQPPPEPPLFDAQEPMYEPVPTAVPAPLYPPPPDRRSRRVYWWGVWCGVFVSCD